MGTLVLLNQAKESWGKDFSNKLFYHVSTDEVYGSLEETGWFSETTPYDPKSPYAASKASADHFVKAYVISGGDGHVSYKEDAEDQVTQENTNLALVWYLKSTDK